jgi:transposase-like protein
VTSKKLLSTVEKVSMWQLPVVLHMDGTFKLNENEFLVITLGVSDGAQQMHIMSLRVISHHTEDMYLRVIQGFKDILCDLFPLVPFNPKYLMTDAEHAERTALVSIFPEADTLMCYFHVIQANKDKLSGNKHRDAMLKDITSLNTCPSVSRSLTTSRPEFLTIGWLPPLNLLSTSRSSGWKDSLTSVRFLILLQVAQP